MPLVRQEHKEVLVRTCRESFIILIYEFIGTTILTTLVANYMYQMHTKTVGGVTGQVGERDNVGLLLGMFICIMFSARISGSHFNPAITVSYIIGNVSHGGFDRLLGLCYIGMQFAGAIAGGIVSQIFCKNNDAVGDHVNGDGVLTNFIQLVPDKLWA